jgi:hypothetical protein
MSVTKVTDLKKTTDPDNCLGLSPEEQASTSGVKGAPKSLKQPIPEQNASQETKQKGSVMMTMGEDPNANGLPNAGTMQLVAGALSAIKDVAPTDPETGQQMSVKPKILDNVNASQIALLANSDLKDANFAAGSVPRGSEPVNEAAAIISSDNFIADALDSLKLITGRKPFNAKGGKISTQRGIEIIAGNDDSDLQSLVKGENLALALTELKGIVDGILGTLEVFVKHQNNFNKVLKDHTHPDIFSMLVGLVAAADPFILLDGEVLQNPKVVEVGTITEMNIVEKVMPDGIRHKKNLESWRAKFLGGTEKQDIRSKYNKGN